ncbi:MAG: hypothetical protein ACP5I3_11555, partial [Thermoproteus sp.]
LGNGCVEEAVETLRRRQVPGPRDALAAAALYALCRGKAVIRLSDLVRKTGIERRKFHQAYRALLEAGVRPAAPNMRLLIHELTFKLAVSDEEKLAVYQDALRIYEELRKCGRTTPPVRAALAVYAAAYRHGYAPDRAALARASRVSAATLSERLREGKRLCPDLFG